MSSMQVTDELLYRYAPMAENLWISQLPSDEQIPVHNFSKRFEKRMRKLIKDQRRSPSMRHFVLMTKRVAAIALVISVLSFSGLMTVEAYRVKFIEIVTEVFNNTINFIITPKDSSGTGHVEDVIFGYLPEDLVEIDRLEMSYDQGLTVTYADPDGKLLDIYVEVISGQSVTDISINVEGAVVSNIMINGNEATAYTGADYAYLMWEDKDCLILITSELPYDETIKVAQNIQLIR